MNIKINFKLPLKNSADVLLVSADTLLNPFYVSEKEVLAIFLETWTNSQFNSVRELIFMNSIKADDIIKDTLKSYSYKELSLFRRNLVLCLTSVAFGNKFNSDFLKSLSRSKSLAEFSVSTTATNDPQFVMNLIKDSQKCVDEAKALLDSIERSADGLGLIKTFVKGACNDTNRDSARLWHHYNLSVPSSETHASKKKEFNGRFYKNGGIN